MYTEIAIFYCFWLTYDVLVSVCNLEQDSFFMEYFCTTMTKQAEVAYGLAIVDLCWNDLSEDFKMSILMWLPVEFVYKYWSVCKEWNALLSSKYFLTSMWEEAPNNKNPWLLLCDSNGNPLLGFQLLHMDMESLLLSFFPKGTTTLPGPC